MAVNASKQVIGRDMFVETKIIEQPRRRSPKAHHRRLPPIALNTSHCSPTSIFL